MRRMSILVLLAASLTLCAADAYAQQGGPNEPVYGRELMTEQERLEYREHLRNAETAEERERFRLQHHQEIQRRAQERGITMPDMSQPRGGMGQGGMSGGTGMQGSGRSPGAGGNADGERRRGGRN